MNDYPQFNEHPDYCVCFACVDTLPARDRKELKRQIHVRLRRKLTETRLQGVCFGVAEIEHRPHEHPPTLMNVDHIIPRSLGGTNELENLRVICYESHQRLNAMIEVLKRVNMFTRASWLAWQSRKGPIVQRTMKGKTMLTERGPK